MKSYPFLDEIKIIVEGGSGGDGCRGVRKGRCGKRTIPDGGNGGNGGDVILKASSHYTTFIHLSKKRYYKGKKGSHGEGNGKDGKKGANCIIPVPIGTQVFYKEEKVKDLVKENEELIVAEGGRGGRGNITLKRVEFAEPGKKGRIREIILKLILLADIGIIGFPNSGKSTLLSQISSFSPKIADYPFTTTSPNLGVFYSGFSSFVVADIPGIIKDAHKGRGLGNKFLTHLEKTSVLIHLLDGTDAPLERFEELNNELALYDKNLLKKPQIVVLNKIDLKEARYNFQKIKNSFPNIIPISAKEGKNISLLIKEILKYLKEG